MYKKHKCKDCDNLCGRGYDYCKPCGYKHRVRPRGLNYTIKVTNRRWFKKGHKLGVGRKMSEETKYKLSLAARGHHRSLETEFTSQRTRQTNNSNWRGGNVGYYALHAYMQRNFEWPKECAICGIKSGRLELASRDYKYTRDIDSWWVLCKKCHIKYDKDNNKWGYATEKFNLVPKS